MSDHKVVCKSKLTRYPSGSFIVIKSELVETVDGLEFSAQATVTRNGNRMFGQCLEEALKILPYDLAIIEVVEIWRRYHLNGMRAGCEHQRAEKWEDRRIPFDNSLIPIMGSASCDERGWKALWVRESTHPDGLLCKPCPTCGYRYGTSWLFEKIPDETISIIKSWPESR